MVQKTWRFLIPLDKVSAMLLLSKNHALTSRNLLRKLLTTEMLVYLKEATTAAKNFVISMESGQNVCASLETAYATQMRESRKIITSIVKTVIFCASNNIPLRGHSEDKGNFMKLLQPGMKN